MTCVIGFKTNDNIIMSCDTQCSNGYTKDNITYENTKIIKRQGLLFGISGSCLLTDLLRYHLHIPAWDTQKYGVLAYVHKLLIPEIKRCFKVNNFSEVSDNVCSMGGDIILGIQGRRAGNIPRLLKIQCDFSVLEVDNDYCAIGIGELAALGAIYGYNPNREEEDDIKSCLITAQRAANFFNVGVSNEVIIKSLKDKNDYLGYEDD